MTMYREAEAIISVETQTSTHDKPEFTSFNLVQNIRSLGHKPKDILVFNKAGVLQNRLHDMKIYTSLFCIEITGVKILKVSFVVVYATPNKTFNKLTETLKIYVQRLTVATSVVGDFKRDIKLLSNLARMNERLLDT